jgi:hypothetical protein
MLDHLGDAMGGRLFPVIERVLVEPALRARDLGARAGAESCGKALDQSLC